jgi:hypothetical protein
MGKGPLIRVKCGAGVAGQPDMRGSEATDRLRSTTLTPMHISQLSLVDFRLSPVTRSSPLAEARGPPLPHDGIRTNPAAHNNEQCGRSSAISTRVVCRDGDGPIVPE